MNEIKLIEQLANDNGISLSRLAIEGGMSNYTLRKARTSGGSISTRNASAALNVLGYGLYAAPLDARLDERDDVTRIDDGASDGP